LFLLGAYCNANSSIQQRSCCGWLDSYHSFHLRIITIQLDGISVLCVINDGLVPAKGFYNRIRTMIEIITYILSGELAHKDSMGNVETTLNKAMCSA
jgi:redox-sensitive bicupin YhaK (pirin superfamily)